MHTCTCLIVTKVEENLPDYKTLVREKFENMLDLEPADRADIVDVIKSFLKNTNKTIRPKIRMQVKMRHCVFDGKKGAYEGIDPLKYYRNY